MARPAAISRGCLIAMLVVISTRAVEAQTAYVPLEVGNEWTYYTLIDPPGEPYDTLDAGTYSITESIDIDGHTYFRLEHPEARADTVRVDDAGRVWARVRGEDVLYFDFSVDDGESYTFTGDPNLEYTVTVRTDQTVDTRAGTFENAVSFHFAAEGVMDADRQFTFAPGVGIVYTVGGMGEPSWLYAATIGGEAIPTLTKTPERPSAQSLDIYPNPSPGSATISIELQNAAYVTVSVVDVAGRRIATIADGSFALGRHDFAWSAQRSATGVYFIVLQTNGQRVARPVILTK